MEITCMEEGCGEIPLCRTQREEMLIKLVHHRGTQLLRLTRFTVAGLLLVVTVGLVLASLLIFGYQHNSARCQHIPSSDDHFSEASAQQQQQEKKQVNNPSALLTALQSSNSTNRDYLEWNAVREDARLEGHFTYSGGDLVVPRDGYYKIYLQITYWNPGEHLCEKDEEELTLNHSVQRFETAYPKYLPLLSSYDTVSCSMLVWKKSMYTAALFHLKATDRLRVVSMHPKLMSERPGELFFGADLEPR